MEIEWQYQAKINGKTVLLKKHEVDICRRNKIPIYACESIFRGYFKDLPIHKGRGLRTQLLGVIDYHYFSDGEFTFSNSEISRYLKCSQNYPNKILKDLERLGYITTKTIQPEHKSAIRYVTRTGKNIPPWYEKEALELGLLEEVTA